VNFGSYFRALPSLYPKLPMPKCIYCSSKASAGCKDCGAPLCKKHASIEADTFKCRAHRKRVLVGEVVKGEIG
jgi:hypothetical protein